MTERQDVRISGLSDKTITGSFERTNEIVISWHITDEFATSIYLDLKDSGSEFSKIIVTHGEIDRRVWLHISGPTSPNDRETVRSYGARLDSYDRYQIYKPDNTRLAFEECLLSEVRQKALVNPNSDIAFETTCKKPD